VGRVLHYLVQIIFPGVGTILLWGIRYRIANLPARGLHFTKALIALDYWLPRTASGDSRQPNEAQKCVDSILNGKKSISLEKLPDPDRDESEHGDEPGDQLKSGADAEGNHSSDEDSDVAPEKPEPPVSLHWNDEASDPLTALVDRWDRAYKVFAALSDDDSGFEAAGRRLKEITVELAKIVPPELAARIMNTRDDYAGVGLFVTIAEQGRSNVCEIAELLNRAKAGVFFSDKYQDVISVTLRCFHCTLPGFELAEFAERHIRANFVKVFFVENLASDPSSALRLWRKLSDKYQREVASHFTADDINEITTQQNVCGNATDAYGFASEIVLLNKDPDFRKNVLLKCMKHEHLYDFIARKNNDLAEEIIESESPSIELHTCEKTPNRRNASAEFESKINECNNGGNFANFFQGANFDGADVAACANLVKQYDCGCEIAVAIATYPTEWGYDLLIAILNNAENSQVMADILLQMQPDAIAQFVAWTFLNKRQMCESLGSASNLLDTVMASHAKSMNKVINKALSLIAHDAQALALFASWLMHGNNASCLMRLVVSLATMLSASDNGINFVIARKALIEIHKRVPNDRWQVVVDKAKEYFSDKIFVRLFLSKDLYPIIEKRLEDLSEAADAQRCKNILQELAECPVQLGHAIVIKFLLNSNLGAEFLRRHPWVIYLMDDVGKPLFEYIVESPDLFKEVKADWIKLVFFERRILPYSEVDAIMKFLTCPKVLNSLSIGDRLDQFLFPVWAKTYSYDARVEWIDKIKQNLGDEKFRIFRETLQKQRLAWIRGSDAPSLVD
jgi:hypothetical protein